MISRRSILLLVTVTVVGAGCNGSNGNGQTSLEAPSESVLKVPSATDQAETTMITVDSTKAVLLDSSAVIR